MKAQYLRWPDYLILVAFLLMSLAIGLYHALTGGRQKTTTEFIMANRSLGVIPAAISLLVSFLSAVTILGTSAEMYSYGAQYFLMIDIAYILALTIIAIFIVPWLHALKLVSINEYLARRFQARCVVILGSSIGITSAVMYMGAAIYAPSIALQSATGFSIYISIPLMAVVSVAYTSLGGMRAVIWTDVFQFGIMIAGILAVLIRAIVAVGSVGKIAEVCAEEGRLVWADFSLDPTVRHTVWGFLSGWTFMFITLFGLTQSAMQRYSATDSIIKGRQIILLSIPGLVIMNSIACCTGLSIVAYYAIAKCDPILNGDIENNNQILPYFVTTMFVNAPGFTGLFLATLYGGALSSVSSSLSGSAANLWEDVLKCKLNKRLSDSKQALLNRLLVVLFGFLATAMAFITSALPGPIIQVTVSLFGSVGAPLGGLLLLGGLNKIANWKGAVIGVTVGLSFSILLSVGSIFLGKTHPTLPSLSLEGCYSQDNITHTTDYLQLSSTEAFTTNISSIEVDQESSNFFFSISYNWFVALGFFITFTVGSIASLFFRDREAEEKLDKMLLLPVVRRFLYGKDDNLQGASAVEGAHYGNNITEDNSERLVHKKPLLVSAEKNGHLKA